MNPKYKIRREEKHAADAVRRKTLQAARAATSEAGLAGLLDFLPKTPRLAWIGGKTFKQGNGGRKNTSAHAEEHKSAASKM